MAGPTHFVASPSSRRHVRQPEPPDRGVPLPPGRHAPVLALRGQGPLPRDQCGRRLRVLRSGFGDEHAEGPHTGMLINYSKRSRSFTVGFAAPLDLPDRAAACVRRSCLVVTMNPQPRAPPGAPGSQLVQHHAPWRNLTSKHLDAGASHMRCTRCKVQPGAPTTVMHQGAGAHRW